MKKNLLKTIVTLFIGLVLLQSCATKAPSKNINSANIETAMVKAMQWQEENHKYDQGTTDWTSGAYYTGVMRAHMATKNMGFEQAMINMGRTNKWNTGKRDFHADDIVISAAYIYLHNLGNKEADLAATNK